MIALQRLRFPILAVAIAALLAALWAGLLRIGFRWPILHTPLLMAHGPLMVSGFLGTLISLERAVALNRRWAYLAPLSTAPTAVLVAAGGPGFSGPLLMAAGSGLLLVIFAALMRFQPTLSTATMALGALMWLLGNVLWLSGRSIPHVILWWMGFLVLTVAGERLELSHLLHRTRRHHVTFGVATGLLLAAPMLALGTFDAGMRLSGAGLILLTVWLARHDIARRTVRRAGLTRFIAICMLAGDVWLGVGGLLALIYGGVMGGPHYDAILHAVFVGFIFGMIFGHAPIIFPAMLRFPIAFDPGFYLHLGLLHLSLVLRLGGDLAGQPALRQLGGLLNAVAILLFLANTLRGARKATQTESRQAPAGSAERARVSLHR
jgi:hypothetical protein